jgi:hypothetical protein
MRGTLGCGTDQFHNCQHFSTELLAGVIFKYDIEALLVRVTEAGSGACASCGTGLTSLFALMLVLSIRVGGVLATAKLVRMLVEGAISSMGLSTSSPDGKPMPQSTIHRGPVAVGKEKGGY